MMIRHGSVMLAKVMRVALEGFALSNHQPHPRSRIITKAGMCKVKVMRLNEKVFIVLKTITKTNKYTMTTTTTWSNQNPNPALKKKGK